MAKGKGRRISVKPSDKRHRFQVAPLPHDAGAGALRPSIMDVTDKAWVLRGPMEKLDRLSHAGRAFIQVAMGATAAVIAPGIGWFIAAAFLPFAVRNTLLVITPRKRQTFTIDGKRIFGHRWTRVTCLKVRATDGDTSIEFGSWRWRDGTGTSYRKHGSCYRARFELSHEDADTLLDFLDAKAPARLSTGHLDSGEIIPLTNPLPGPRTSAEHRRQVRAWLGLAAECAPYVGAFAVVLAVIIVLDEQGVPLVRFLAIPAVIALFAALAKVLGLVRWAILMYVAMFVSAWCDYLWDIV
jgi:hypothetical protein